MKITREIILEIEKEAKKFFVGASGCHDWTHVERVRNMAMKIGKKEKVDLKVLEIAALLHDIGRKEEIKAKGIFCHAEAGAKMARKILEKFGFEKSQIENIVHCIETHRFRKSNIPETSEARVLFDADKMDSIGAIGVARDFLFAGNISSNLYTGNEKELAKTGKNYDYTAKDSALLEYEKKLKYIHEKMLTRNGREIAKERHEYMKNFFERFYKEIKGAL